MEALILWTLGVYFLFHVLARADLLARPRNWLVKVLPTWMTYPLGCAFCFSWWTAVFTTALVLVTSGWFILDLARLLAAPVINLIVDLCVRALMRANEPPLIEVKPSVQEGDRTVRSTASSNVHAFDWTRADILMSRPGGLYLNADKLPNPTHVGRRARSHDQEGVITHHYIDLDDCSGTYTQAVYRIDEGFRVAAKDCTLLD